MSNPNSTPTPPLPPVYWYQDQFIVRVPGPTSQNGSQVFKGRTVGQLITAMQTGYFHSIWFLNRQNARIKNLEHALEQAKQLLAPLLKGTK